MEKRVFLLVLLCVLVFVGWSLLMRAIYPPAPPAPPAPPPPKELPAPVDPAKPAPAPTTRQPDEPERLTKFANEKIRVTLTNRGAGIREATVMVPSQADMPLLQPFDPAIPHLAVAVDTGDDTARGGWTVKEEELGKSITYLYKLRNGVQVEKKFSLEPGRGDLDMVLTMRSTEEGGGVVHARLIALTGLSHDSPYRYDYYGNGFVATVSSGSHSVTSVTYDMPEPRPRNPEDRNPPRYFTFAVPEEEKAVRQIEWIGLRNRYGAAILVSKEDRTWMQRVDFRATTQPQGRDGAPLKALAVEADLRELRVERGVGAHIARFSLVLSPIRREDLNAVPGAEGFLLSYGCWGLFNPIGRLILWMIGVAYGIAGNFGWAIILTTLVIRVCLFPLTKKSQVSMAKMAELQPKLNLLREKYPDDPAKQQQETMKLFRENKVNPLSGCFPIMMQLPVFIGLYSVLDISLEFRQAPFLAWIRDLSQPDRLIAFRAPIDLWITTLSEFNLVPVVMTVTWFLQSYYAPRPQDPKLAAQQKMMMFMPVVFGLLCYSLASGLSLYLFVNSLLAMIEQKLIKKYFLPAKTPSGPISPAPM